VLTKEAIQAGLQGPVRAQCTALSSSKLADCTLLDPAPSMEEEIQRTLSTWGCLPALVHGVATAATVTVSVPLVPPKPDQGPAAGSQNAAIPFGQEITPPTRISGRQPAYSRNARRACIEGRMAAKCVITTEGTLAKCRILKSLPYMDQPFLDALATWRMTPATFMGKAVSVEFTIPFRLKLK
jgi:periplasmic protein TonB